MRARRGATSSGKVIPLTAPSSASNSMGLPAHRSTGFSPGANASPLTSIRSPSAVRSAPRSFAALNQSIVPLRRRPAKLAKAVHDAAARQIVRRHLDPHTVAEHDTNPVPLQPPGEIAERLVPVVELHAEHAATKSFRDLPLQLDLLFLFFHTSPFGRGLGRGPKTAALMHGPTRPESHWSPRDPSCPRGPRKTPGRPRRAT